MGYMLLPASCPLLLAAPGSSIAHKAQFATKHLWVTAHSDAGTLRPVLSSQLLVLCSRGQEAARCQKPLQPPIPAVLSL